MARDVDIEITADRTDEVLKQIEDHASIAFEKVGMKIERYAKALCPVGTPESTGKKGYRGGTLRDSITYTVDGKSLTVGSNVEYAPYVELGTGPNFTPPPEWEQFTTKSGSGTGHAYVRPRPYLRPAITDHVEEYKQIFRSELGKI